MSKEKTECATKIELNGKTYVLEGSEKTTPAKSLKGMKYVIVRTYSAGVFAGYLKSQKGKEVVLLNARRLWSWAGAASLSQMAMEGTSKPESCKFPCEVEEIFLTEAIETINCTEKAQTSIKNVAIWKQ